MYSIKKLKYCTDTHKHTVAFHT